jgi:hypothetical protein
MIMIIRGEMEDGMEQDEDREEVPSLLNAHAATTRNLKMHTLHLIPTLVPSYVTTAVNRDTLLPNALNQRKLRILCLVPPQQCEALQHEAHLDHMTQTTITTQL